MLGVVGSNLAIFKLEPPTPNTSQQIAAGWPNESNMLRPAMLGYVALACCDRLAGALALRRVFVATSLPRREIVTMSSNLQVCEWSNLRIVFGTVIAFTSDYRFYTIPNSTKL